VGSKPALVASKSEQRNANATGAAIRPMPGATPHTAIPSGSTGTVTSSTRYGIGDQIKGTNYIVVAVVPSGSPFKFAYKVRAK